MHHRNRQEDALKKAVNSPCGDLHQLRLEEESGPVQNRRYRYHLTTIQVCIIMGRQTGMHGLRSLLSRRRQHGSITVCSGDFGRSTHGLLVSHITPILCPGGVTDLSPALVLGHPKMHASKRCTHARRSVARPGRADAAPTDGLMVSWQAMAANIHAM